MLGLEQFNEVFKKAQHDLYIEMLKANRNNELDDTFKNLQIDKKKENKILILGYCQISQSIIKDLCKAYGYTVIDVAIDKESIKRFNCININSSYDLIIIGQLPHKMKGLDCKNSGLIGRIINDPKQFNNVVIANNKSNRVRITKESLQEILINKMQLSYC